MITQDMQCWMIYRISAMSGHSVLVNIFSSSI